MFAFLFAPVLHHAGLRQRKGEEGADSVEGDELIGDAAEGDEDERGKSGKGVDAVREEQAASAQDEDVGKIVVHRDGAGEAGKVGEGGVGAERERKEDRTHGDEVEPAAAEDGFDEQRKRALILGVSQGPSP